jgi:ubiquinone/menaquinone biosynthesis C-methylase UbiE
MESQDISKRWENYRLANSSKPAARENELRQIFSLLSPKEGERILEVGTGNGYLTFPIAEAVGDSGEVVTIDAVDKNLQDVVNKNTRNLPIKPIYFDPNGSIILPINIGEFDAVASIATLHHFDSRKKGTGESGRIKALTDFYRVLKLEGRLVIGDVVHGAISQKYFDAIDNPEHCFPEGHPHDFFSPERLKQVLSEIGFKDIKIEVKRVPWQFVSSEEAKNFVHTIHNAKCSADESFEMAKKYLGFEKNGDHYELGWELFFVTAKK